MEMDTAYREWQAAPCPRPPGVSTSASMLEGVATTSLQVLSLLASCQLTRRVQVGVKAEEFHGNDCRAPAAWGTP